MRKYIISHVPTMASLWLVGMVFGFGCRQKETNTRVLEQSMGQSYMTIIFNLVTNHSRFKHYPNEFIDMLHVQRMAVELNDPILKKIGALNLKYVPQGERFKDKAINIGQQRFNDELLNYANTYVKFCKAIFYGKSKHTVSHCMTAIKSLKKCYGQLQELSNHHLAKSLFPECFEFKQSDDIKLNPVELGRILDFKISNHIPILGFNITKSTLGIADDKVLAKLIGREGIIHCRQPNTVAKWLAYWHFGQGLTFQVTNTSGMLLDKIDRKKNSKVTIQPIGLQCNIDNAVWANSNCEVFKDKVNSLALVEDKKQPSVRRRWASEPNLAQSTDKEDTPLNKVAMLYISNIEHLTFRDLLIHTFVADVNIKHANNHHLALFSFNQSFSKQAWYPSRLDGRGRLWEPNRGVYYNTIDVFNAWLQYAFGNEEVFVEKLKELWGIQDCYTLKNIYDKHKANIKPMVLVTLFFDTNLKRLNFVGKAFKTKLGEWLTALLGIGQIECFDAQWHAKYNHNEGAKVADYNGWHGLTFVDQYFVCRCGLAVYSSVPKKRVLSVNMALQKDMDELYDSCLAWVDQLEKAYVDMIDALLPINVDSVVLRKINFKPLIDERQFDVFQTQLENFCNIYLREQ